MSDVDGAPFVVEGKSPLAAWGRIQRDLRSRIETGRYSAGERIPAEMELASSYRVSRMTVRRAIAGLVADGYLVTKRGSGTFVAPTADVMRYDVDLLRPWRDQLVATGHEAVSKLVETRDHTSVPLDVLRYVEYDVPDDLGFGKHVQLVDGRPIAVTESWIPRRWPEAVRVARRGVSAVGAPRDPATVSAGVDDSSVAPNTVDATCSVLIDFATAEQASLLESYLDVPLLVVTACSRLRSGGELVEVARTSWLANRARLTYGRELTLAHVDMSSLLGRFGHLEV